MGGVVECCGAVDDRAGRNKIGKRVKNHPPNTPEEEKTSAELGASFSAPKKKKQKKVKASNATKIDFLDVGDLEFDDRNETLSKMFDLPRTDLALNYKFEMSYFNMIGTFNDPFLIVEDGEHYADRFKLKDIPTEVTK